jgi:hypothetical protein
MLETLKAHWQHLITKEKALFKSATVYVGAVITALPDLAGLAQSNFPDVAKYLPHAWQDPSMRVIGLVVLAARFKSLIKLPPKPVVAFLLVCLLPMLAHAAPCGLVGAVGDTKATLSATAPTTDALGNALPTGTVLTYNVYRSTVAGSETLYKSGLTAPSYVDTGLTPGVTYFYQMTAVDSGGESARTSEGCKSIAPVPSAAPTPLNVT